MPRFSAFVLALLLGIVHPLSVEGQDTPAAEVQPPSSGEPSMEDVLRAVRMQQEQGQAERQRWMFDQHILVRLLRGKGELAREEVRRYRVRPGAKGEERDLLSLDGKVAIKGKLYPYTDPEYRTGNIDLDGEIAESFATEMLFVKDLEDGDDDSMYPLSRLMMERHRFTSHGKATYQGRSVYRFTFAPNPKGKGKDKHGFWEGEVLVDCDALAPVLVVTHQARNLPVVVRTLLGTNVQQFGYKLEYAEMPDGTWFPSRYSGEFSLRVLFGYSRRIALSARNENFERASAETEIHYDLDHPAEDSTVDNPPAGRSDASESLAP
ncbi:MAG: hypothetical protein KIT83_09155 [Bryobacterales bacterium]|nr:hypothetical protein [Bryobacterales bacterium]